MIRLWPFRGGLHLENRRQLASELPLADANVPRRLIFPLLQRGGADAEAVVSVGDGVARGQVLARGAGPPTPPIHASCSGVVVEIGRLPLPHPSGLSGLCIVIESDGADRCVSLPPLQDYASHSGEELRQRLHDAGIVGLGGAAFPTAVKLAPRQSIDTLILNGAECEPYISCDDSLMRHFPREVLEGAKILLQILGAQRCLLGIEEDMPQAIAALREAQRPDGCGAVEIVPVPAIYPAGGERQVIRTLTGRQVPSPGFPPEVGVVCQNVGTAAAVFRAVVHGEPLTSRIVTVTGRGVRFPRNLRVRLGTPIADLIEQCGGYTEDAERLILGGPMMGYALARDDLPIVESANCVLVAASGEFPGKGEILPCIRCGACADACPVALLPQQIHWYSRAGALDRAQDYGLFDCIECGCCDLVCPSHIPLAQQFRAAKSEVTSEQREREQAERARIRFESRRMRLEQEKLRHEEEARRRITALKKPGAAEVAAAIQRAKARREAARTSAGPETPQPDSAADSAITDSGTRKP